MTKQRFTPAYPAELRERGVRLFRENRAEYASDTAAYKAIAPKLGCSPDSLRVWCQQAERDSGQAAIFSHRWDQNNLLDQAAQCFARFVQAKNFGSTPSSRARAISM